MERKKEKEKNRETHLVFKYRFEKNRLRCNFEQNFGIFFFFFMFSLQRYNLIYAWTNDLSLGFSISLQITADVQFFFFWRSISTIFLTKKKKILITTTRKKFSGTPPINSKIFLNFCAKKSKKSALGFELVWLCCDFYDPAFSMTF